MNEGKIYSELIYKLFKEGKVNFIDLVIKKIKNEGKSHILRDILSYVLEKYYEEKNLLRGKIKLAFKEDLEEVINLLEKKLKKRVEVEKIEIDKSLILGGVFLSKNLKVDFSLKKILKTFIS